MVYEGVATPALHIGAWQRLGLSVISYAQFRSKDKQIPPLLVLYLVEDK